VSKASLDFLCRARIVQLHIHRVDNEHRVFDHPGRWFRAQHEILERPGPERRNTGVDALCIRGEYRLVSVCSRIYYSAGPAAKAMKSMTFVNIDGDVANHFRQLPRRLPPDHVHLKEAVLPMCEPCREREVLAIARGNNRNTIGVTRNTGRRRNTFHSDLAIQRRQAGTQCEDARERGDDDQQKRRKDDSGEQTYHDSALTVTTFIALVLPETPSRSPLVNITRSSTLTRSLASRVLKIC